MFCSICLETGRYRSLFGWRYHFSPHKLLSKSRNKKRTNCAYKETICVKPLQNVQILSVLEAHISVKCLVETCLICSSFRKVPLVHHLAHRPAQQKPVFTQAILSSTYCEKSVEMWPFGLKPGFVAVRYLKVPTPSETSAPAEMLNIGEKTAIVGSASSCERANSCERARRGKVSHHRLHT